MQTQAVLAKEEKAKDLLVSVRDLRKWFPIYGGIFSRPVAQVRAVDGVNLDIITGETLGLVGESGCGKTTIGRVILGLLRPTTGTVIFDGRNLFDIDKKQLHHARRDMQIVFQDPYASLDPRMTVEAIVGEPLKIHKLASGRELQKRVLELLDVVGLSSRHAKRYPHEFSGGQRQRIGIARALALRPKLVVCDEPVSALDVSIRSQIINLLSDLQTELKLTYLFITHDLSVVENVSDRVAVMYLGKIVEISDRDSFYNKPLHPYTKALLSAIPMIKTKQRKDRIRLEGDVPSPIDPPKGCRFNTRCWLKDEVCQTEPELNQIREGHYVACHFAKTE